MEAFDLHKYYTVPQPHPLPRPQARHTAETWSGQLQPARSKRSARLGRWGVTTLIEYPSCPCPHACTHVLACTLNVPTYMYTGAALFPVDRSSSDSLSSLICGTAPSQMTVAYPFLWSRVSGAERGGRGVLTARHCGWAGATSSLMESPSQTMHSGGNLVDVSESEGGGYFIFAVCVWSGDSLLHYEYHQSDLALV